MNRFYRNVCEKEGRKKEEISLHMKNNRNPGEQEKAVLHCVKKKESHYGGQVMRKITKIKLQVKQM